MAREVGIFVRLSHEEYRVLSDFHTPAGTMPQVIRELALEAAYARNGETPPDPLARIEAMMTEKFARIEKELAEIHTLIGER